MQWPDFSVLERIPWGFVLGAVTLVGLVRRKSGHRRAQREFPELARKLGLEYRPSPYRSGVGRISGNYEGLSVVVDPDDQRGIVVRLTQSLGLDLSLTERPGRPRVGYERFRPDTRGALRRLVRAYGSPPAIVRLESSATSREVEALLEVQQVKTFLVTEESIVITFDFGSPPYLPGDLVQRVLRVFTSWAGELAATPDTPPPSGGALEAS
jgi:hypothetical protein